MSSDFPSGEPMSLVEAEMRDKWYESIETHLENSNPETWQRRVAARGAYEAVYYWNRSQ